MVIEIARPQTTMSFTPMERGLILAPAPGCVIEMVPTESVLSVLL
jgi:hypothetical protein